MNKAVELRIINKVKLRESVFFQAKHISRWCETRASNDLVETFCAIDMRYIGIYEHVRENPENLGCEVDGGF